MEDLSSIGQLVTLGLVDSSIGARVSSPEVTKSACIAISQRSW